MSEKASQHCSVLRWWGRLFQNREWALWHTFELAPSNFRFYSPHTDALWLVCHHSICHYNTNISIIGFSQLRPFFLPHPGSLMAVQSSWQWSGGPDCWSSQVDFDKPRQKVAIVPSLTLTGYEPQRNWHEAMKYKVASTPHKFWASEEVDQQASDYRKGLQIDWRVRARASENSVRGLGSKNLHMQFQV